MAVGNCPFGGSSDSWSQVVTLIVAALDYVERGWRVLPMRGKEFYTRDGVKIATRDPKAIAGWTWPENVGLACGEPSGVDVLDVDDPQGCPLDVEGLVATTLAATTPGGGYHLFYRHAGLRSRNFQWGEWRSTGLAV